MIQKLTRLDIEQLQDAYGAWFDETYEKVWEEEARPIRHYVRRPWGRVVRTLYRLHWYTRRWTSLMFLYPLVQYHPEYVYDFAYTLSLKRRIVLAWRGFRCDWTDRSHYYRRRRYGYGPPIWKADA